MPETRYMRHFDKDGNELPPTPYIVSDKELQAEADLVTCQEYLAKSPDVITPPEMWWLLRYYAKLLGVSMD